MVVTKWAYQFLYGCCSCLVMGVHLTWSGSRWDWMWWLEKELDLSRRRRCITTKWPKTRLAGIVCACLFQYAAYFHLMYCYSFKGNGPSWVGEASQSQSAASEATGGGVAATNSLGKSEDEAALLSFSSSSHSFLFLCLVGRAPRSWSAATRT